MFVVVIPGVAEGVRNVVVAIREMVVVVVSATTAPAITSYPNVPVPYVGRRRPYYYYYYDYYYYHYYYYYYCDHYYYYYYYYSCYLY